MNERVEREVLVWRDRMAGNPSPETRAAFETWLAADPSHGQLYQQQEKLWTAARKTSFRPERPHRALGWHRIRPQLAISVAVAAALVALWPRNGTDLIGSPTQNLNTSLVLLSRPERLADGTLIVLGPGARVTPEQTGTARRVRLSGGPARFIVAPDHGRAFIALAGPISVVTRTAVFDIELTGRGPLVRSIEGTVTVNRDPALDSPALDIQSGQMLDPAASAAQTTTSSTGARLGPLEVENMAVVDVLAIAERGAGTQVALADPALGRRRVTGRFDVSEARALGRKLAAALDLTLDETGDTPTLRPR